MKKSEMFQAIFEDEKKAKSTKSENVSFSYASLSREERRLAKIARQEARNFGLSGERTTSYVNSLIQKFRDREDRIEDLERKELERKSLDKFYTSELARRRELKRLRRERALQRHEEKQKKEAKQLEVVPKTIEELHKQVQSGII